MTAARQLLITIVDAADASCGKCNRVYARSGGARCSVFRARLEWDNDLDGWMRLDACRLAEKDAKGATR